MGKKGHDMGRFDPNPLEPREPFLPDEMFDPASHAHSPSISLLKLPSAPISQAKLAQFVTQLRPLVNQLMDLSRSDQHKLAAILQNVKNDLHSSDLSQSVVSLFERVTDHFNGLLIASRPIDQKAVLRLLKELQETL